MSGHSKWSTIKRQKGANDAKRGQIFTKLANAISIAVREGGGGDPTQNFKLRLAIDAARAQNMPKENIERAIDRGLGKNGAAVLETVVYEGFGPGSVAVIAQAVTDNRNRTAAEIKTIFDKNGGVLGQPGSVAWQFEQVGEIVLDTAGIDLDTVSLAAIDAGAIDVFADADAQEVIVTTVPDELGAVRTSLENAGYQSTSAALTKRPKQPIDIPAENVAPLITFLDRIESLDDITDVFVNAVLPQA